MTREKDPLPAVPAANYYDRPPPDPSPRLLSWKAQIAEGWRPPANVRQMGYLEAAEWFGVYLWEYTNELRPLFSQKGRRKGQAS